MAAVEDRRVDILEQQLQEAMSRISKLTTMLAERPRSVAVGEQVSQVAAGTVRVQDEGAGCYASQTGASSREVLLPEQPSGGFLLQQTFNLPPFSLSGAISLSQYFQRCKEHCSRTYAGGLDEALPLLQPLLVGEVAEIFAACGGTDTAYCKLKQRMLRWVSVQNSSLQQSARIRFDNAKRRHGEDLSLFALRLSSLFEDAYPAEDMQGSDVLRDRLIQNLPESIGEHLKLEIKYNRDIHGKTLQWDHYLTILQNKKNDAALSSSVVLATDGERPRNRLSGSSRSVSGSSRSVSILSPAQNTPDWSVADRRNERGRGKSQNRDSKGKHTSASRSSSRGRSNSRSQPLCDHCGRRGHTESNCHKKTRAVLRLWKLNALCE